jgi:3-oxoacyl-(acyl-carrier-protein) synthase
MARFAQYAMVASEEALNDAEWSPDKEDDLEATVGLISISSAVADTTSGCLPGLRHWESR